MGCVFSVPTDSASRVAVSSPSPKPSKKIQKVRVVEPSGSALSPIQPPTYLQAISQGTTGFSSLPVVQDASAHSAVPKPSSSTPSPVVEQLQCPSTQPLVVSRDVNFLGVVQVASAHSVVSMPLPSTLSPLVGKRAPQRLSMRNGQNVCFANSVFQALATPAFIDFLNNLAPSADLVVNKNRVFLFELLIRIQQGEPHGVETLRDNFLHHTGIHSEKARKSKTSGDASECLAGVLMACGLGEILQTTHSGQSLHQPMLQLITNSEASEASVATLLSALQVLVKGNDSIANISSLPTVLPVELIRTDICPIQLSDQISVSVQGSQGPEEKQYQLQSVIVCDSDKGYAHYWTAHKNEDGHWIKYDTHEQRPLSPEEIGSFSFNASLLFYHRCEALHPMAASSGPTNF